MICYEAHVHGESLTLTSSKLDASTKFPDTYKKEIMSEGLSVSQHQCMNRLAHLTATVVVRLVTQCGEPAGTNSTSPDSSMHSRARA